MRKYDHAKTAPDSLPWRYGLALLLARQKRFDEVMAEINAALSHVRIQSNCAVCRTRFTRRACDLRSNRLSIKSETSLNNRGNSDNRLIFILAI